MSKLAYRLYPPPHESVDLQSLYLDLDLHRQGLPGKPFVYANFLSSLDGRIALEDLVSGETYLPRNLTSPNDFRLFQALQAQADCLITHGGYLRSLADGRLGNILQVGLREDSQDLADWRARQGLAPQPDIVVASASLDFPLPASVANFGQKCLIATGADADPDRVAFWQDQGYEVLQTGHAKMVDGAPLVKALSERGYQSIYLIAGPNMLDTMVREGQLSRLFQTMTHQLLGGLAFRTLTPGLELGTRGHLKLRSLYYDPSSPEGAGQWFAQFDLTAEPA